MRARWKHISGVHLVKIKKNENFQFLGVWTLITIFGHICKNHLFGHILAKNYHPRVTNDGSLEPHCIIALLSYIHNDTVIWTNPVPNSTSYASPVSLTSEMSFQLSSDPPLKSSEMNTKQL